MGLEVVSFKPRSESFVFCLAPGPLFSSSSPAPASNSRQTLDLIERSSSLSSHLFLAQSSSRARLFQLFCHIWSGLILALSNNNQPKTPTHSETLFLFTPVVNCKRKLANSLLQALISKSQSISGSDSYPLPKIKNIFILNLT